MTYEELCKKLTGLREPQRLTFTEQTFIAASAEIITEREHLISDFVEILRLSKLELSSFSNTFTDNERRVEEIQSTILRINLLLSKATTLNSEKK